MQQYRVNFPLLIGLAIGIFVSSGAVYALWKFQIERRSGTLITEAEKAHDAGKLNDAVQYLSQYVKIKPGDTEQKVKFAETCADLAEQFGASMEDRGMAVRVMEATLRELPNEKGLRKRLASIYGKSNMFKDALAHLDFVLDDPEAQLLRAAYLIRLADPEAIPYSYKLIGYNPDTKTFEKGTAPNDPITYLNLAVLLRGQENSQQLADQIMEQAVTANPDVAKAYLARGQYLYKYGEIERGLDDFEKAHQLSPEDADVLATMAQQAAEAKEYDKSREFIAKGKKLHPKNARFYQLGAAVASAQEDYKGALAEIDEGLKQIPPPTGYELLLRKVELQITSRDHAGARTTIGEMRRASIRPEICDWFEAKILLVEEKWFQANETLVRLRPLLSNDPRISAELNFSLGLSYQKLGQHELAIRAFSEVLNQYPDNDPARYAKQLSEAQIGRTSPIASDDPLQRAVQEELKKPKAEQKWDGIQALLEKVAEEKSIDETGRKLYWGQVLLYRKEFAAARTLAAELYRTLPEDARVHQLALDAVRADTAAGQGPAQALLVMERLKLKDLPRWRLYKADLFIMLDDEQTKPQLASLLTNIDGWEMQDKVMLWSGMADRYLGSNLRLYDEARRLLSQVAENQPDDLQTRMRLFNLALDTNDDAGAMAAQDAILKVVGSKEDANWLFTEARRRFWLIRRGRQGPETIGEIRKILERALEGRPEWHELHALSAEVELASNNFASALKHLDQAESLGRLSPAGIAQHVKLLASDGQLVRASERLKSIPEILRPQLLGDLYTELMFRTNEIEDAITTARAQAEANPENHQLQYRYGQLLARSAERPNVSDEQKKAILAQAIAALEQAVKVQPDFADGWYSLILFNALAENPEKAQRAMREMQLSLSGDSLQFVLAKCYEALGRWFDAEPMYRAVYEADPENIERAQQLAAFYVGPGYRQRDMRDKVAPLINQILRAGADGKIPQGDRNLLWARRTGARLLAATGDYQQLRKAEKMLASNSQDGRLSLEDRMEMAQILAPRPEPESRRKATWLLEEIDQVQPLNAAASLTLGNLYFAVGDWNAARTQMRGAIARYKDSPKDAAALRARFADMWLRRGDQQALKEAENQIAELRKLAPNSPETFRLASMLAIKLGRQKVVHDHLISVLNQLGQSPDPKAITDDQVPMMDLYANLLVELKDLDRAEQIQRLLAKRDPKRLFALALFLGTHRDVAQCFELLDAEFKPDQIADTIRTGVGVIRIRRGEIGDKFDARVEDWLDRGLRANPGSIPLMLSKAEFLEIQQKYPQAIALYSELLANQDITGFDRAVLLNNLSYLAALANSGGTSTDTDPLQLVQEAAEILGPRADILDTRAVVLTARKRYDEAIQDLELSVLDNPTASKYYHKAVAHLRNNQNRAALDSWAEAERLGLTPSSLNPLEYADYEATKTQIERLRADGKKS